MRWGVALPLHPEFRTLPMVWYVPPLSPVVSTLEIDGYEADPDDVFGAIDHLRIPLEYLANLLTAGDVDVVRAVLHRLAAMRAYMRKREVLGETDDAVPDRVGLTGPELERMYRLLAIANYEDRYVIPQAHAELGERLMQEQGGCGLDFDGGPGNCGAVDPRPDTSSPVVPYDGERFHLLDILKRDEHAAHETRRADPPPRAVGAAVAACCATRTPTSPARATSSPARSRALPDGRCATRSSASSPAGRADRPRSRRATSRRSTCAAARASTSPTTRTATRASAAWRCCG